MGAFERKREFSVMSEKSSKPKASEISPYTLQWGCIDDNSHVMFSCVLLTGVGEETLIGLSHKARFLPGWPMTRMCPKRLLKHLPCLFSKSIGRVLWANVCTRTSMHLSQKTDLPNDEKNEPMSYIPSRTVSFIPHPKGKSF